MLAQFALNAMGPALVVKHAVRLMPKGREAKLAVLSARVGSIGDNGLGGWYSYRAAKAALNQLVHTAAIEVARSHPLAVLACLHPGTVASGFAPAYVGNHPTVTPDVAAGHLLAVLEGLTSAQTGGGFGWGGRRWVCFSPGRLPSFGRGKGAARLGLRASPPRRRPRRHRPRGRLRCGC